VREEEEAAARYADMQMFEVSEERLFTMVLGHGGMPR